MAQIEVTEESLRTAVAGHVAARVQEVLAAANCLTDDLADTLARAEELRGDAQGPPPGLHSQTPAARMT